MNQGSLLNKYCFDTSSIFDFWLEGNKTSRPYHVKVDSFRKIWVNISKMIEGEVIVVPKVVGDELIYGNPELIAWVKSHRKLFVPHSECKQELTKIVNEFQAYASKRLNKLHDAIVIATAMRRNLTVVTSETFAYPQQSEENPKVPNVCEHFKIKWMNLPEFFEAAKL